MEEQTIAFKTAKLAKEKGFNVPTRRLYNDGGHTCMNVIYPDLYKEDIPQPTQALLQKWLRETHQISIVVDDFYTNGRIRYDYKTKKLGSQDEVEDSEVFETYEEALEAGLVTALNTLPSK